MEGTFSQQGLLGAVGWWMYRDSPSPGVLLGLDDKDLGLVEWKRIFLVTATREISLVHNIDFLNPS